MKDKEILNMLWDFMFILMIILIGNLFICNKGEMFILNLFWIIDFIILWRVKDNLK